MKIEPVLTRPGVVVFNDDCIEVMKRMPPNSIDAIVCDPPYGLGFMGKKWDDLPPGLDWAEQCLKVLKPGGHLLAFGGTRTWHRLAVAIEDAGFDIRDSIAWLYGSGMPKSHNISKAIDKAAGHDRASDYEPNNGNKVFGSGMGGGTTTTTDPPVTPGAEQWEGWGTGLKPAYEPVVWARKPTAADASVAHEPVVVAQKPRDGTFANNVLTHGVGGLNIDGCRIGTDGGTRAVNFGDNRGDMYGGGKGKPTNDIESVDGGRWPANVILDPTTAEMLDEQSGYQKDGVAVNRNRGATYDASSYMLGGPGPDQGYGGGGGASRFFKVVDQTEEDPPFRYVAKAPTSQRPKVDGKGHPTVKPLDLMRYLVRLVTPPGGIVLDTFAGSGTTGEAAVLEGFRTILIEQDAESIPFIEVRLDRLPDND